MNAPITPSDNRCFQFPADAAEASLFDRRGLTLWKKKRDGDKPLVWEGVDDFGQLVPIGAYTCKITFMDGRAVYVPFVLMK